MAERELTLTITVDDSMAQEKIQEFSRALNDLEKSAEKTGAQMSVLESQVKEVVAAKQDATDKSKLLKNTLQSFEDIKGSIFGNIRDGINKIGVEAGLTVEKLGMLGTAGAIMGAGYAGWQVGRMIADFFDLDTKIAGATARLMGWGNLAGETMGAKQDVINKAIRDGAEATITYTDAIAYNKKVAEQTTAAWKALIDTTGNWKLQLEQLKKAGQLDNLKADIEQHVLSIKELASKYGLTQHAAELYRNEVNDGIKAEKEHERAAISAGKAAEQAHKRAAAEAQKHADEVVRVKDKVHELEFGYYGINSAIQQVGRTTVEIDMVKEWVKAREAVEKVENSVNGLGTAIQNVGTKVVPSMADVAQKSGNIFTKTLGDAFNTLPGLLINSFRQGDFWGALKELGISMASQIAGAFLTRWASSLLGGTGGSGGLMDGLLGAFGKGGAGGAGGAAEGAAGTTAGLLAQYAGGGLMAAGGVVGLIKSKGKGANTLAGLEAGAGIGTMIFPGVGTAIGAGIGAAAGFLKGWIQGMGPSAEQKGARGQFAGLFSSANEALDVLGKKFADAGVDGETARQLIQNLFDATHKSAGAVDEAMTAINDKLASAGKTAKDTAASVAGIGTATKDSADRAGASLEETENKIKALLDRATGRDLNPEEQFALKNALDEFIKDLDVAKLKTGDIGKAVEGVKKKASEIPENPFEDWIVPPGWRELPGPGEYTPMAKGGAGMVTKPTLFLAGEAGPEEFAFSGANKKLATSNANAPAPLPHIVIVRSPSTDPADIFEALPDAIKHNYRGLKTKIMQAVA